MTKHLTRAAFALLFAASLICHGQTGSQTGSGNRAIDFKPNMPFSNAVVAGNTLYVAGQQGPALSGPTRGKVDGLSIEDQTTNTIAAIQKVVSRLALK